MREKIDLLIFFSLLIFGMFLFVFPSYSDLLKEERNVNLMRRELMNSVDELAKLKDTLNMLSKQRENLLTESQKKVFDKKGFSIFLKELSLLMQKHKITSFSLTPEELQDVPDLPEGFPFKIKKLPINFQFIGKYQSLVSFFQELELQNYPIKFSGYKISLIDPDKSLLNFQGKIEIYLLVEG